MHHPAEKSERLGHAEQDIRGKKMALKEFSYRGKSLEELKKLSIKEFAQLLPARQRRTLLRGITEQQKILLLNIEKKEYVKTHVRDMIIIPQMIGKRIQVHKGNGFFDFVVEAEMVGHRLGEFAMTRKSVTHHSPGVGATKSSSALSVR
jgi:small subunit ribosomal protein S19